MGGIFSVDNKLNRFLGKCVDVFLLSIMWVISCIPLFTVGTATSALYRAVYRSILHGRGYAWREYINGFKENLKQATAAWLINALAGIIFGLDAYMMYQSSLAGETIGSIYTLFLVLLAFQAGWANYIFSYIARFEDSLKRVFRNTAVMAVSNPAWTLLIIVMFAFFAWIVYILPEVLFFVPALYMVFLADITERVFKKFMSPEMIAEEDEGTGAKNG